MTTTSLEEGRRVSGGEDPVPEAVGCEPVSPTGQYFNSSVLSVCILGLFESEIPIDDSPTMDLLQNLFLPVNSRFSSVMVRDKSGMQQWKRVPVKLEDHVKIPFFPTGLSVELYDGLTQEYLTRIAMEPLPQHRPLWELHIIKYPTFTAEGTMVFKLHHALGDGFSLMGAIFSVLRRADDPSRPLTFPTVRRGGQEGMGMWHRASRAVCVGLNTIGEFGWSLLKSSVVEDDRSPVRSGNPGVEFRPIAISCVTFSLEDIKKIKGKLGATVNDVITGIIFYGIHLYVESQSKHGSASNLTALVLLNTRVVNNYQTLKEMTSPDAESPWGNQFGFLHVSLPKRDDPKKAHPLDFVYEARDTIRKKRNSLAVYITGWLLETLRKLRGPEVTAKYIHNTLRNTSMTVSNLIGPLEQMHVAGHPVRSFYFMVVSVPQSLTITMVSYMGKLKVAFGTEKDFINKQVLISCMEQSFTRIFQEAHASKDAETVKFIDSNTNHGFV